MELPRRILSLVRQLRGAGRRQGGPMAEQRTSDLTNRGGGVMTDEVGAVTGDLTLRTDLADDGTVTLTVQYKDADEWYKITGGKVTLTEPAALDVVPHSLRNTGETFGVFATRAPTRPNAMGLSRVRILGIEGTKVRFAGVDLLDGTPILDIKPFIPGIDVPAEGTDVRAGWLDRVNR